MASMVAGCGLSATSAASQLKVVPSQTASNQSKSAFNGTALALPNREAVEKVHSRTVNASLKQNLSTKIATGLTALSLATTLQFSPLNADVANAAEANILAEPPPEATHLIDDAGVLNRVTRSDVKRLLTDLEEKTGYHVDMVTLRKITTKGDVFELADKILEKWYPTREEGDKKGVVLLVTTAKEGVVTGGPSFISTIGDELLEAIATENLPVLATAEKYNEAMYSTAKRIAARLSGQDDIPGPRFNDDKRQSNFKSKAETSEKRGQFTTVVGGLLVIAFVVPMLQYYAYVSKK